MVSETTPIVRERTHRTGERTPVVGPSDVARDQSALLEVLDAGKAADIADRIRSGQDPNRNASSLPERDVLSDRCAARQLITARPSAT